MKDDPVERLWCFAFAALLSRISEINTTYRWARIYRVENGERPSWSRSFSGDAFVLCESCGIYNGSFGQCVQASGLPNRDGLIEKYHKKYPTWKQGKIERVVDESIAKVSHKTHSTRGAVQSGEIFSFLNTLCITGNVEIVLVDGGTMSPEIGGTRGLSESAAARVKRLAMAPGSSLSPFRCCCLLSFQNPNLVALDTTAVMGNPFFCPVIVP